jgi:hypothetical protein
MTLITNIAEAIKSKKTEEEIDIIIQNFIDEHDISSSKEEWKIANYVDLRRWAYPDTNILNDAMVKINSGIELIETEGQQQLEQYYKDCLEVKQRFPKS